MYYVHNIVSCSYSCFSLIQGILNDDGTINNAASTQRLAEVSLAYAKAGKIDCFNRFQYLALAYFSFMIFNIPPMNLHPVSSQGRGGGKVLRMKLQAYPAFHLIRILKWGKPGSTCIVNDVTWTSG